MKSRGPGGILRREPERTRAEDQAPTRPVRNEWDAFSLHRLGRAFVHTFKKMAERIMLPALPRNHWSEIGRRVPQHASVHKASSEPKIR